ncbi:MAG: putative PurR-regulated permease PerM [Cyanobacteria bacterium RYN_339]|nr:putative PurR-regulated permease PerM [Cyanobacteria bacterium RYN_339]
MAKPIPIAVSPRSAVAVLALLGAIYLMARLVDLLLLVVVVLILAAALGPAVAHFHDRLHWPRLAAVLAVFGLAVGVLVVVGVIVVPTLIGQAQALSQELPSYTARLTGSYAWLRSHDTRFHLLPDLQVLSDQVSTRAAVWLASGVELARKAAGAAANISVVLVATFFVLLEAPTLKQGLLALIPEGARGRAAAQFDPIALKLGGYVQGLGMSIGCLTAYLGLALTLAGVPMSLVLALVAGMLELIPMVGSILGSIPAILLALTVSWKLALVTAAIFAVGNFLQGNFVAPYAFSRSVALSPVLVLFALLVGAELFGFAGALIAIPVLATIQVLVQNLYLAPRARGPAHGPVPVFDAPLPPSGLALEPEAPPHTWSVRLPEGVHEQA